MGVPIKHILIARNKQIINYIYKLHALKLETKHETVNARKRKVKMLQSEKNIVVCSTSGFPLSVRFFYSKY